MRSKTQTIANTAASSTFAPAGGRFQPRLFMSSTNADGQAALDLDTQRDTAELAGHNFGTLSATHNAPLVIQPKLKLGPVNDKYEQEADRMAGRVAGSLTTDGATSRRPAAGGALWEKPAIQRASADATAANLPTVDPGTASAIQQARGGGRPLSAGVRAPIENALGMDFSGVRVHTDARADRFNRMLDARAFTVGRDIFFGAREFNPSDSSGRRLLAHELTHVVQQSEGGQLIQRNGKSSSPAFRYDEASGVWKGETPHGTYRYTSHAQKHFWRKKTQQKSVDRRKVVRIEKDFKKGLKDLKIKGHIRTRKNNEFFIPDYLREKIEDQEWYKDWKGYFYGLDQAIPYDDVVDLEKEIEEPMQIEGVPETPSAGQISRIAKEHPNKEVGGFSVLTWQSWNKKAEANLKRLDKLIERSEHADEIMDEWSEDISEDSDDEDSSESSSSD